MSKERVKGLLATMELPVINAPMFLVSGPELVIESCRQGIMGSFPLLNARTSVELENWLIEIKEHLKVIEEENGQVAPWAVNLIVHKTNKRFENDLALIAKYQPPIVITSLGKPNSVVQVVHEYGGLVFSDVATLTHARKAAETGVDGLILVTNGAGGHGGLLNPMAFIASVKEFWKGITILAGSITNGNDILAAQVLGADFSYMGTRFISANESMANESYQKTLLDSTAEDLVYTDAFSGVPANYLSKSVLKAGYDIQALQRKEKIDVGQSDAKAWKDIFSAGQGVGTIHKIQSVEEIVAELKQEYTNALEQLNQKSLLPRK
ncbi:NAD(P)H-dependent flavin oxidoreductase [Alkalihalobacillus pseudalcaliphilus]|uniref:NAD(P)H-dependent flavin oxidoreductase n=1 Tax=Alkalihalobacillus pseudalcaliphilus TaxID=79884 RepID=UPI00064DB5F8|nr:nitronate monooxygenase [Alkalihalobacillus pseudalcaliphilus]KMK76229.1 2-nitropropane dioxygenase [Alkalihalobacillus pseudalcaliphilus]